MTFSVKNLRNITTTLVLLHPVTFEPLIDESSNTAVELEIVGADSKQFADSKLVTELKTLELVKERKTIDAAEHRKLAFDMFCSFVVGWNDTASKFFAEELGENSSYSPENATRLLTKPEYWWIVHQIEKCIADRNRFFTKQ